jgi:pimeloyl-ACP methyl ester carboxylesterase
VGNSAGGYVAQQLAIRQPDKVKTLALYAATPGLKNSQAHTWIPRVQEVGLKKFLAETIHERFDDQADPQLVRWFIEQAGSNDRHSSAASCCMYATSWRAARDQVPDAHRRRRQGRSATAALIGRCTAIAARDSCSTTSRHSIGDQYADRCTDDHTLPRGKN